MPEQVQNIILANNLKPLVVNGGKDGKNAAESWKLWKQKFKIFFEANDLQKVSKSKQIAILLNSIGDEGLDIYNSFNIQNETDETITTIIEKFDGKFNPCKNVTVERYNFFTKYQNSESLDEYVTILNNLASGCKFENLKESLVKDMFIIGIKNTQIKEQILQNQNITNVDEAVQFAKNMELSQERSRKLQNGNEANNNSSSQVQSIRQSRSIYFKNQPSKRENSKKRSITPYRKSSENRSSSQNRYKSSPAQSFSANSRFNNNIRNNSNCNRCGQLHRYKCPAQGKICNICKKMNHFANYCFYKNQNSKKNVSTISSSECIQKLHSHEYDIHSNIIRDYPQNDFIINSINCNSNSQNWKLELNVHGNIIRCQIDTGADINVISLNTLKSLENMCKKIFFIEKSNIKVFSFAGQLIENLGSVRLECSFDHKLFKPINFIVVKCDCSTILGWRTCEECGIVKRIFELSQNTSKITTSKEQRSLQMLINKYSDTFEGLGCLPGNVNLQVDTTVTPRICPVRRIPYALQQKLKNELDRMVRLQVIEKVTKPTDWVNSIVPVEKPNGDLRICLDPRNLNKAIKRPHFPYPTFDDLRSRVVNASVFSKLDANSGYWMLKLDPESSDLCTFNTQFGRYKFLRLPYGINSSGEIFHRVMSELLGDLPGVIIFVDDILVYGSTQSEHDERLENVLKKAKEINLKFNKSKCQFGQSEVSYVGHVFNKNGISPDTSKIEAIIKMPRPENIKDLQRFLGMINYLGSYVPNLAHETTLLRELLKKQNMWQWTPNHEKQFTKLKSLICQSPVLVHYDVNKPVRLSVDASKNAVGAVIFHGQNPIAYASKTLNKSQENYAQIEKELYAIVFGCKKFHQYIYGKTTYVETDHQPLVTLFKKSLSDVPPRLQRMMIAIQSYDLNVSYTKGTEMYVSDTLSRAPISKTNIEKFNFDELDSNIVCQVNLLTSNLAITKEKQEKIMSHTKSDMSLQKLKEYFMSGWPNCKQKCDSIVLPYWNIRDEIHVVNDLVFKNQSVIIPKSLRSEILSILHEGHMGIEKTKNHARGTVFWPNIYHDIEMKIKQCETCMTFSSNKTKETLLSHEQPSLPWQKVATDLFDYKSKKYLIVVDYYSNYIEIAKLNQDSRSYTVINQIKSIFSRHGIPLQLVSDGGPPFNSHEFQNFTKDWDIQHIMSSPHFPRSNGLAEVSVKIVKNILRKCEQSGTDFYIGLLQYRNTPRGNLKSPSELLMSRKLRTKLPTTTSNLKPKVVQFSSHLKNKSQMLENRKLYYDRSAVSPQQFQSNDIIFFKRNPKDATWSKGVILSKTNFPRSYLVKDSNGTIYRRNSYHIKLFKSNLSQSRSQNSYKSSQSKENTKKILENNNDNANHSGHKSSKSYNKSYQKSYKSSLIEKEDTEMHHYYIPEYLYCRRKSNEEQIVNLDDSYASAESSQSSNDENPIQLDKSVKSNVMNKSRIQSPIFVEVNDDVQNNEYLSENEMLSQSQFGSQDLPEMLDISISSNTPELRYSSRGRLLKSRKRLDL